MSKLINKSFEIDFSDDILNIFKLVSFDFKNLFLSGTANIKNLLYFSDFDLYERVDYNKNSSTKLKDIIKNLLNVDNLYITDIKAGKNEKYEVINNSNEFIPENLDNLLNDNIITKDIYKKILKYDKNNFNHLVKMKEFFKFHIVRLKPYEILNLTNNEINELILTGGLFKIDFIYWIAGNKYSEFSIIYDFFINNKQLNKSNLGFEKSILYDIKKYENERNYFKMSKRLFSLKLFKGENVEPLINLFNSSIGLLSYVKSLVSTLKLLIEKYKNLDFDKIEFEISNFKNKLSNVILPSYLSKNKKVNDILNKLINLPNSYNNKYIELLDYLENFLYEIVNKETKKYLIKSGLYPKI